MPLPSRPKKVRRSECIFIGIDPGGNGGIAAIYPDRVEVWPTPDTEIGVIELFRSFGKPCQALIELITPAFAGTANVSKLYGSYRALRMALVAAGIPFEAIRPQDWQKALDIPKKTEVERKKQMLWKDRLCRKARKLFPKLRILWKGTKGKQRQVADALLLAYLCRNQLNERTRTHR